MNRAVWDLRRDRFQEPRREGPPSFFEPRYLEVLPGTYTVTVKYKEQQAQGTLRVVADPRYQTAPEDRQANWQTIERAGRLQERLTEAIERLRSTRDDVDVVLKKLAERKKDPNAEDPPEVKELRKSAKALKDALTATEKRLWRPPDTKGLTAPTDAWSKVSYALRAVGSSWEAPTPANLDYLRQAEALAEKVLADNDQLFATKVADFRQQVAAAGIALLPPQ